MCCNQRRAIQAEGDVKRLTQEREYDVERYSRWVGGAYRRAEKAESERDEAHRQLAAVVEALEEAWQSDHMGICRRLGRGRDFRKCLGGPCPQRVQFLADLPAAAQEIGERAEKLAEALREYGNHDPACTLRNVAAGRRAANCSCGFDAALREEGK